MRDYKFVIKENIKAAPGIYRMVLEGTEKTPGFTAGQFINIEAKRADLILRRPFCIYKSENNCVTIIYAVVGKGTANLSCLGTGEEIMGVMPLGNGFNLKGYTEIAIIAGGIGAAPLLENCRDKAKKFRAYLGFSDKEKAGVFLGDYEKVSDVYLCTDDGSAGFKGYPTELLRRDLNNGYKPDVILTCGPEIFMKEVQKTVREFKIPAYMSGETRMGCGYGACLVCACKVNGEYKRACYDGPVFDLHVTEL